MIEVLDYLTPLEKQKRKPAEKQKRKPSRAVPDWHKRGEMQEPPCANNQWRTKDRYHVMNMSDMDDEHLGHSIRFATTRQQHGSRLAGLLAERASRAASGRKLPKMRYPD